MMQTDFLDSHERHWDDAEHLFQHKRWANADHLYGIAAECGLKRLMIAFGMTIDPVKNKPKEHADQKHADIIWARYELYRSGHKQGMSYVLPSTNPFQNWDVAQRYAAQIEFDQPLAESHQKGAKQVHDLLRQAKMDGLI